MKPPDISAVEWFGRPRVRSDHSNSCFSSALELASQPNYLGSPDVVSKVVGEYFGACVEYRAGRITFGELQKQNIKASEVFSGVDQEFTVMPAWHTAER